MKEVYAVIETGGKQYQVAAGQKLKVESLHLEQGQEVDLPRVLLIADGAKTIVGNPEIEGAKVTATCLGEGKNDKIIVFKYKNKVRYRRKKGHRQPYTELEIKEIVKPGGEMIKKTPKAKKVASGGES